jgi:flagellar hook-basal body complex protein FliE
MTITPKTTYFSDSEVFGSRITLKRTSPRHLAAEGEKLFEENSGGGDFSSALMKGLGSVNALQQESLELSQRAITDPDSVDAHDVMTSLAKAEMGLNITKGIIDRALRAYRELTGAR